MENNEEYKSGFVGVLGRPNVGKSTFINAVLGQKIAAVSPRPQTTRRQQLAILTRDDAQVIFTDTPGVHRARNKLGNYMNEEAVYALEDSDAIIFIVDASVEPDEEDLMLAELLREVNPVIKIFLVLNKVDLLDSDLLGKHSEMYSALVPAAEVRNLSALNHEGVAELLEDVIEVLPEHPPFFPPDQITDLYEREIAADLIREAALNILKHEVPHSIAVRIDEFTEREDESAYIEATLLVERDSQKGIVIGSGGKMIKRLGIEARQAIEQMSGRKIFLRLRVKVRKNWRNDDKALRSFGFRGKGKGI